MSFLSCRRKKWHDEINCGCKINLRLKVTSKRQDNLHNLSSCFLFLEHPGDRLAVEDSAKGILLTCPGHEELENENNLVYRAAELFAAKSGITESWHFTLEKNVPLAAGLGGGSADAAAVLLLLNRHYQVFEEKTLTAMAFSLGADVPFFLHRSAAWVTGAGENTEILTELPEIPEILIVNPGFPVSAKWGYANLPGELIGEDDPDFRRDFAAGRQISWQQFCRNDLAPALIKKFPLLDMLRGKLLSCGALAVQISGSGPSLFALFASGAAVRAKELRESFSGMTGLRIFAGKDEF